MHFGDKLSHWGSICCSLGKASSISCVRRGLRMGTAASSGHTVCDVTDWQWKKRRSANNPTGSAAVWLWRFRLALIVSQTDCAVYHCATWKPWKLETFLCARGRSWENNSSRRESRLGCCVPEHNTALVNMLFCPPQIHRQTLSI